MNLSLKKIKNTIMKFVKFAGKVWKVINPPDLKFELGIIRNVLLERGSDRIITNMNKCKRIRNPGTLDNFT